MSSAKEMMRMLLGTWRLTRIVTGSHQASATGLAVFQAVQLDKLNSDRLTYNEMVEIILPDGSKHSGHQSYNYQLENDQISVYFKDGQLFHKIQKGSSNFCGGFGEHVCAEDKYQTHYFFTLPDQFSIVHTAYGPQKNYTHKTDYTRKEDDSEFKI